jgi:hypothetical protein
LSYLGVFLFFFFSAAEAEEPVKVRLANSSTTTAVRLAKGTAHIVVYYIRPLDGALKRVHKDSYGPRKSPRLLDSIPAKTDSPRSPVPDLDSQEEEVDVTDEDDDDAGPATDKAVARKEN